MPRHSMSLVEDLQAKKDQLCSIKYPEYSRSTTAAYIYKPATCVKKGIIALRRSKVQIKNEIQRTIDELIRNGVMPIRQMDADYVARIRNMISRRNFDSMFEQFESSVIVKCVMDITPDFIANPVPAKENAKILITQWCTQRGLMRMRIAESIELLNVITLELMVQALRILSVM